MTFARYVLGVTVLTLSTTSALSSQAGDRGLDRALAAITPEFLKAHITFLGDDLLQGRRPGTRGYDIAARYVAASFEAMGLQPAGDSRSYFQRVPLLETKPERQDTVFTLERGGTLTDTLVFGRDFVSSGHTFERSISVAAPLVFAGYGIDAPELNYNDYEGADVKGKVVVVLFGGPPTFPSTARAHYSSGLVKAEAALRHGAVGVLGLASPALEKLYPWELLVADTARGGVYWLDRNGEPANAFRESRVGGWISTAAAEKLFLGSSVTANEIFEQDSKGERVAPAALQAHLRAQTASTHRRFDSANVAAILRGGARPDEYVVYSSHLDHLGVGDPVDGDDIYNGVLDNASGVAGMLGVAKAFSTLTPRPLRSVLFLAVTAEEVGLIGSDYFARNPTVPTGAIVANVNIDGLPVLYDFRDVVAFGSEHSSVASAVQAASRRLGVEVSPDPLPEQIFFVRSDQYSFVKQGVPAVFATEGLKAVDPAVDARQLFDQWVATRYHRPSDDLKQPLNFEAGVKGAKLQFLIGHHLASDRERPRWNPGDFFGERFGKRR